MLFKAVAAILSVLCCFPEPVDVFSSKLRQQLDDGRYICGSMDIRNSVQSLNQLRNCSVVDGFVHIVLIERATPQDFANFSFPELIEITCYLLVFRVNGLVSLERLFPNLTVIRGHAPFFNYALVIHDVPNLAELGLWSLAKIMRGSVYIYRNPELCYVDTVDWASLVPHGDNKIGQNKNNCSLPAAACGKNCSNCWGHRWWERCGRSRLSSETCSKLCVGSCKDRPDRCTACTGVLVGDSCREKCPSDRYEFLGRRCITEVECREIVDPHPVVPDPDVPDSYKDKVWWPFNGSCVHSCPIGFEEFRTVDNILTCKQCLGGRCHRKCNGTMVRSISSSQLFKGCTYIKGALEIQIQGGRNEVDELAVNLGHIEEIEGYLKVSRSFPLLNLNFFQNLKVIHGRILEQGKYAVVVMENNNLEDLWDWTSRPYGLTINNGSLFFHFNPKLCLSKIEKLQEISGAPNFSNSEVARESNGDQMACEIKKIKSYVKTKAARGVVIEWEPYTDVAEESFVRYIVYYIEAPYGNVTFYDGRDACNSYGWRTIDVTAGVDSSVNEKQNQLLAQLKPFTQYAFYIETYSITNKGGRSEVQYFTTLPDRPTLPTKFLSVSNSSSEIILTWEAPIHPNGLLTHYVVSGIWQRDNQKYLDHRDYCTTPLKLESEDVLLVPSDGNSVNKTESCCIDTPEKFEISDKVIYEHMCDSKHLLLSKYTDKSHVGSEVDACYNYLHTYLHEHINLNTTKQLLLQIVKVGENSWKRYPPVAEVDSEHEGFINSAENYTVMENGAIKNFTYLIDAKKTSFVLHNLHHFALYTINLHACRRPLYYMDENGKNYSDDNFCSYASIANTRTLVDHTWDEINFKQMAVDRFNQSLSDVYISWKEPKRPNGAIVMYHVEYRAVDTENSNPGLECITRKQHERNGGGSVIRNLSPGNYSFRVRATSLAGEGKFTDMKYYWVGEKPRQLNLTGILIIIFICLGVLVLIAFILYLKVVKMKKGFPLIASVNPDYVNSNECKYVEDEWEIERERVTLLQELGQGFFGTVYAGTLSPGESSCAVKTVSENASPRQMMEFLNEASVMKSFSDTHHVVKLLGVVSKGFPPLVVMELMVNGDLKSFLRAARNHDPADQPSLKQLLLTAAQIADGMAYLGDNKFVHRDLAARNCMVTENFTVKIGDFGMTRDIYETDYYRNGSKGLLPVRWMAPESLGDGVFTSQSDVWSYGVVLWEIATLGEQPYQGISNEFVLQHVLAGGCLESPLLCPDILRRLMELCWQAKPSKRPRFTDIISELEKVTELGELFKKLSYYCNRNSHDTAAACDTKQDESEYGEASTTRPNITFYHSHDGGDVVVQWQHDGASPDVEPLLQPTEQSYVVHGASSSRDVQPKAGNKIDYEITPNGIVRGCALPFQN